MSSLEPSKEEYQNLASQLQAVSSKLAQVQRDRDQLQSTITDLAKANTGWCNFGGATWFSLESLVEFKTMELPIDPLDENSPKAIFVSEFNGKYLSGCILPKLDAFLAILDARKKSRWGGGGGGGDLPNAPIPKLTQPTPGPGR